MRVAHACDGSRLPTVTVLAATNPLPKESIMNVTAPSQNGYEPFNVAGASLHKALALTSSIRTHVEQTTQLPDWQDTSLTDAVAAARDAANMIEQNMLPSKFGIDPQLAISLARTGADQLSVMGFDSGWK